MKVPRPDAKKARIEIIPMIDAIFFLLVFFMFSSLSMVKMKGVGVALPTTNSKPQTPAGTGGATGGAAGATQAKLVVTIDEKGRYFVGKTPSSAGNLATDLSRGLDNHADALIIVNVAPTQNTQDLIAVMDVIGTLPPRGGKPLQVLIASEKVDANGAALKTK